MQSLEETRIVPKTAESFGGTLDNSEEDDIVYTVLEAPTGKPREVHLNRL